MNDLVSMDRVLNIPITRCYVDMRAYRSVAAKESSKFFWYGKMVFGRSTLLRKRTDGRFTLSLPERVYRILVDYLSTKIPSFNATDVWRFERLTVGDIYLNIPHLSSIPRCGEETARTILAAFILLKNRMSDFGIELNMYHWQADLKAWKHNKKLNKEREINE